MPRLVSVLLVACLGAACGEKPELTQLVVANLSGESRVIDVPNTPGTGFELERFLIPGDFDGDGRIDVFRTDGARSMAVLGVGLGPPTVIDNPVDEPPCSEEGPPVAADVNGDGADDILCFFGDRAAAYTSLGDGTFDAGSALGPDDARTIGAGDLDGDGTTDLVVGGVSQTAVYLSPGGGPQILDQSLVWPIVVADFNEDGRADVGHGEDGGLRLLELAAGAFVEIGYLPGSPLSSPGDVNVDGVSDALELVEPCYRLGVDGTQFGPRECAPGSESGPTVWGDFDGDGLLDAAQIHGREALFWLGTGEAGLGAQVAEKWPVLGEEVTTVPLALDLDDDARSELLFIRHRAPSGDCDGC